MNSRKLLASWVLTSLMIGLFPQFSKATTNHLRKTNAANQQFAQISQNSDLNLPTVAPGDRGQAVLVLQRNLKELGYYTGLLDGVYENGFVLADAVRKFQSENGLPADGVVGPATWRAIQRQLSNR